MAVQRGPSKSGKYDSYIKLFLASKKDPNKFKTKWEGTFSKLNNTQKVEFRRELDIFLLNQKVAKLSLEEKKQQRLEADLAKTNTALARNDKQLGILENQKLAKIAERKSLEEGFDRNFNRQHKRAINATRKFK